MRRAGIVALNTFREAVRDRVLYNLVFFALLMMAAAVVVGQISIGIEESVIVSLGLSAISVIGLLISVFIGVGLVSKRWRSARCMHCWPSRCGAGSFAGEIRRPSVDAGREHGGDGCGALSRDALREAFA